MSYENLEATEVFRSALLTLNVRLDLISFERLLKARLTACALAPWLSESTHTGGKAAPNRALAASVQNAFRVRLGDGIHGSLFMLSVPNAPSSWKSPLAQRRCLRIIGPRTARCEELELRSIEPTGKPTVRFASVLQGHEPTVFFCLRLRTWNHFLNACGLRGQVTIPPRSRQLSLWQSKAMAKATNGWHS